MKYQGSFSPIYPKRFGRINRNELRWVLYGKGLPMELIRNILQRRGKHITWQAWRDVGQGKS